MIFHNIDTGGISLHSEFYCVNYYVLFYCNVGPHRNGLHYEFGSVHVDLHYFYVKDLSQNSHWKCSLSPAGIGVCDVEELETS